ncbi:hypothetical protein [Desulfobacula sp.]|nr:hypothetical protein [Desulfobacula sp.]
MDIPIKSFSTRVVTGDPVRKSQGMMIRLSGRPDKVIEETPPA